ncbi:trigger factor [Clostridium vitabionis]|uniref:trigger factor n=1 Tax=Clostridium vitabionis TaxID=2784388 RepID=UPI00188CA7C9|nr:trigger factor [Clostridium vitabionis]
MSVKVEQLEEKNMIKLTIEVPAEKFDAAIQKAYNHDKNRFNIPGFRKGKAPLQMFEKMYGLGMFYDAAANTVINESYPDAVKESKEEIVSNPKIDVVQIEKGKDFIYTAEVATKPEITLGEYKGLEIKKPDTEVTDEDINKELENARNRAARKVEVTDRPVKDGDETVIDFKGFVDGKPFEGGEGEDYPLTIGSHQFIEGFEEQLIGKNLNEKNEINVTFPKEYHVADLAGKPATFEVTVKKITEKQLPELNDEFADNVSDFSTLEEYKADLKKKIGERKEREAKTQTENEAVDKAIENASIELPKAMVDTEARGIVDEYAQRLRSQGLNLADYMKYTGQTMDKLLEQVTPDAEKRIKTRLVLEKVAEAENIQVSDEDYNSQIEKMAADYNTDAEKFKKFIDESQETQIKEDMKVQKAIDLLVDQAKLV